MSRRRVLLVSLDPVGERMAGLGIRYTELARVLAAHADVTLAAPAVDGLALDGVRLVAFRPHHPVALREALAAAHAVVAQPQWPWLTRRLARSGARLVFDLYDPETLETLEIFAGRAAPVRRLTADATLDRLHDALAIGHHFMCASESQRDLWLGAMLARRMLDPARYDADPTLRSTIDLVPFGVPAAPPRRSGASPFEPGTETVLWNGGIWSWFDAATAIRAAGELAARRPSLRLVFMGGGSHPVARRAAAEARALAAELGLLDRVVRFNDDWVPYAQRADWLTSAGAAITTAGEHLETRFAFRTRVLDCFWAGLPVVCTTGDSLAARVERDDLGATAPPGDHLAVAAGIERVLDRGRDAYAEGLARAAADHAWPRVAAPLVRWVTDPSPPPRPGRLRRAPGHALRAAGYAVARRVLDRR